MRPLAVFLGLAALGLVACGKRASEEPAPSTANVTEGASLYASLCATCHGDRGQGGVGPKLEGWSRGEDAFVRIVVDRMPQGAPERCDEACARAIAKYVLHDFADPLVCDDRHGPRVLRLLTKREYRATVLDLVGAKSSAPCGEVTFRYDPSPRAPKSIHVAGSFNGWPGTIAEGGWPLAKGADGAWSLTKTLLPGHHTYKFVIDEKDWVADPKQPSTEPDGFGGNNSVLDLTCAGTFDPAAGLPDDARPEGFAYDSAEARVVTTLHADAYRAAAANVAARVTVPACTEAACAETWVRAFGRRAFRRPLTEGEVARYRGLAVAHGTKAALQAFLASPKFLYRSEVGVPQADGSALLDPFELATALSYTLVGTTPDDALLDAAEHGALDTNEGLEKEARRLLEDPRARDVLGAFALQWVGASSLATAVKVDPSFDDGIRAAMAEETRRFVAHVVLDGSHRFEELFTADYTFADAKLASFYGLSSSGDAFAKIALDGKRAGVLGHGSLLASTAHSDQSSPIRRGLLVRRQLLCQELPPPPPNAGGVPDVDPKATTRERFAQHTANSFCKSCHQYIDPVGFGFERFDAVGKWRESENGMPIDAAGDLNDAEGFGTGTHAPFSSLPELGAALAKTDAAKSCFVDQWLRFSAGTKEERCVAHDLRDVLDRTDDLREVLIATVLAPEFRRRK